MKMLTDRMLTALVILQGKQTIKDENNNFLNPDEEWPEPFGVGKGPGLTPYWTWEHFPQQTGA